MYALDQALLYAARLGVYSEWHPLLFYANALLFPSIKAMGFVLDFIQKQVEACMTMPLPKLDGATPSDFTTRFLHICEENPQTISKEDIMAASMSNIRAGSDTTSISLTSVLCHLCRYPDTLWKLRARLMNDAFAVRSVAPSPSSRQRIPYLQAVIKEALRIHPATGLILGRVVPEGGSTIAGQFFPAGVCKFF